MLSGPKGAVTMKTLDADAIISRATPLTHQQAHEIQPFGHLVRMPIALSEHACKESVDKPRAAPLSSDLGPRSHRHPAAVDVEHGSVHVARLGGGEEDDRLGDLFGVGGAAKWNGRNDGCK